MTIKNPQTKGYLLALLAAFTATNTYFTSKHILNSNSILQFGILWYGFGLLFNTILLAFTGKLKGVFSLSRKDYLILFAFSVAEGISTTAFFTAIKFMENPVIVSFLVNLTPIMVTVFGFLFLKERFNKYELLGITIAIIGAFMVCFHWEIGFRNLFVAGSEFVFIAVLFQSVNTIFTKKYVATIDPALFSLARVVTLFAFTLVAMFWVSEPFSFSANSVYSAIYGALIGPLLGAYAIYYSLKYIPASKSVIIQSFKSFLILIFAYFILGLWPLWIQVVGGFFCVSGIILITLFKKKKIN
jgi:drug/metabolite transporter (DMT)-like permease